MNVTAIDVTRLGLFPLADAARLAQIDNRTARRWAEGHDYAHRGSRRHSPGVMPLTLPLAGGERDLTFAEMLTLRLVGAFRRVGLSLRTIKRAAVVAAELYGTPLPFVSRRFRTDGRKVFLEITRSGEDDERAIVPGRERHLIEILSGQANFAELVEPSLFANLDWHEDIASRWWPMCRTEHVVLDPEIMFGAPHIDATRIPTDAIAAAVHAEAASPSAVPDVARWFGVPAAAVLSAVRFEDEWLARAA